MRYFSKTSYMSEKELNAYRLTSMEEPTDEMLYAIMKEAAAEATASTNKALADYFKELCVKIIRYSIIYLFCKLSIPCLMPARS